MSREFFRAEKGIREVERSRGRVDVYKRQGPDLPDVQGILTSTVWTFEKSPVWSVCTVELTRRNWRITPARLPRAGFRKFSKKNFMHRARAARPRGFDSLPSLSDVGTLSFRWIIHFWYFWKKSRIKQGSFYTAFLSKVIDSPWYHASRFLKNVLIFFFWKRPTIY